MAELAIRMEEVHQKLSVSFRRRQGAVQLYHHKDGSSDSQHAGLEHSGNAS